MVHTIPVNDPATSVPVVSQEEDGASPNNTPVPNTRSHKTVRTLKDKAALELEVVMVILEVTGPVYRASQFHEVIAS